MEWIKVTDRLPPDMEPVMVTAYWKGNREVLPIARYNEDLEQWEYSNAYTDGWDDLNWCDVTHWAPWPEPAED